MTPQEFDSTDPRDLAALWSAWKAREQRKDFRFATIVCSIANLFRKEGSDPVLPSDVFPSLPAPVRERTPEEIAEKILSVAASFGAEVDR